MNTLSTSKLYYFQPNVYFRRCDLFKHDFLIALCIALQVLTKPQNSGRFNFTTQFPYYKEILHKPDLKGEKKLGKNVVFDMDMSAGDFLALLYLLKLPAEMINLKVRMSATFFSISQQIRNKFY